MWIVLPFREAESNMRGHIITSVAVFLSGIDGASLFPLASKSVAVTDPPLPTSAVTKSPCPVLNIGLVVITAGVSVEIGS